MKIKTGLSGQLLVVFPNQDDATRWEWLFHSIFRMHRCCAGRYDNAYCWYKSNKFDLSKLKGNGTIKFLDTKPHRKYDFITWEPRK